MFKILIAEDDNELRQLFKNILVKNGYIVKTINDGLGALNEIEKNHYDLLISDIMMPNMDGYDLVKTLRDNGSTIPVMMITAKDSFNDMRLGFMLGTDEYMVKPINVNEMVIRVGALLRRVQMQKEHRVVIGETILEYDTFSVYSAGETIELPLKEFMVLYKMASYPNKIFTRQQLMVEIWGYDSETDMHTVDVHIERLRKKFKENNDFEILTIRGIGYKVSKK